MRYAAKNNHPRALYLYGYDQMRNGNYKEALEFVNRGLKVFTAESYEYEILFRRKEKLEKKLTKMFNHEPHEPAL